MFRALRRWLGARRDERRARELVADIFSHPERLAGTSLRRRHASRWVYVGHTVDDEEAAGGTRKIATVRFGILRHPRPYSFSRQSHRVVEYYTLHVEEGRLEREKGVNLTRQDGRDAD